MTAIDDLHALGQSLWLDDIRREWLESGELKRRIEAGQIRGMTSNPSIFESAIAESDVYAPALRPLAQAGWPTERILDALMFDDIRAAADLFRPLYESTSGGDGFVSLEVNPSLADDTEATVLEARRLWSALNRPNVMIKIPATRAGVPAVRRAIADGINVNVTLIFSLTRYAEVIEAYLAGLEERAERGAALDHVASVASFFISRVDTTVDGKLEAIVRAEGPEAERAASLRGQAAIANAKLAYAQFQAAFLAERFAALRARGGRPQRPLWASTSTKNPAYPDTYYVDTLIGPDTVNTVPPVTLDAFADHGRAAETLTDGLSEARSRLDALGALGIPMAEVTDYLERQGVEKFAASFQSLSKTVEKRAGKMAREVVVLQSGLRASLEALQEAEAPRRLWAGDASLWPGNPGAWLGWLELPRESARSLERLTREAAAASEGRTSGFLLGMGGSSLASSILREWGGQDDGIALHVLDTIEPGAVRKAMRAASGPLVVVASKSGTTVEPLTLMEVFWSKAKGGKKKGKSFLAITDPGTPLEAMAKERYFQAVFSGPPDVGGRYSALSAFGLVPGALAGVDLPALLEGAASMARRCGPNIEPARNPGFFLGALLASAHADGRDKMTLFADPDLQPFLPWIEQLVAESSGKNGKGLVPVVGEPPAAPGRYGADRLIVYLRLDGSLDRRVDRWVRAKVPVVVVQASAGVRGLGAEFFRWEVATAVACHRIGVNAFDQPDVESAKAAARQALAVGDSVSRAGASTSWVLEGRSGEVRPPVELREALAPVLGELGEADAFVLLSFLPETPAVARGLLRIRRKVRDTLGLATLAGFGPRYLHSTGQLFKGGPDRFVFLILHAEPARDVPVPGQTYTLGDLLRAQAIGDFQAMKARGRRAHILTLDTPKRLSEVAVAIESLLRDRSSLGAMDG